ncbi:MAG: adenylate/guanylate cyclase domain-containing protein [Microthrixaceae bacterium]
MPAHPAVTDPDQLDRLARMIDEIVLPDADRYTLDEVSARAGTDPQLTRRLWRALGFADPGPDDRIGGDADVLALQAALDSTDTSDGVETLIRQTRVMSAAMARVADLWVDQIRASLDSGEFDRIEQSAEAFSDQERFKWLIDYIHRRLFAAALRRELANRSAGTGTEQSAVFADLVGYTTLSERLGPLELSELVGSFEAIAYDTVAEHGARVVKTIGDEVLFAADDREVALATTVDLLRRAHRGGLPPLRAGIDHGPAVWFEGDLFGPTVNRAARLVAEAPVGAVAASASFAEAVADAGWTDLGVRELKGVGPTEVRALAVAGA